MLHLLSFLAICFYEIISLPHLDLIKLQAVLIRLIFIDCVLNHNDMLCSPISALFAKIFALEYLYLHPFWVNYLYQFLNISHILQSMIHLFLLC